MSENNINTMYQNQNSTFGGSLFNSDAQPTAHITKSRGRLKNYGVNVYLKTGSNFEIELFNPKKSRILAKIMVNGQLLSEAGLILNPGQRVYLERFIDDAKKLVFETYEVEDSAEAKQAISENGKIKVVFYDELVPSWNSNSFNTLPWLAVGTTTHTFAAGNTSIGTMNLSAPATHFTNSVERSIETGRIEKGENSGQSFSNGYGSFADWSSTTVNWQILPESKKPVEIGEIRSYCTGCGTRHKKSSWKFCPSCGAKIED